MGSVYHDYSSGVGANNAMTANEASRRSLMNELDEAKVKELRLDNKRLEEENNLLKLKVEVLLDMLAQKTAEAETLENDILKMKNILANT